MIRSILNVPADQLDEFDTGCLTQYKRNCQDLCEILRPFETATIHVQEEKGVSASLVVPCVRGLKNNMKKMQYTYNSKLVLALRESVEKRLTLFEENDVYTTASALDPCFKLKWCNSDGEQKAIKQHLISKAGATTKLTANLRPPPTKRQCVTEPDNLFDFMEESDPQTTFSDTSKITTEVNVYLSQPCTDRHSDPLQFWKAQHGNFPTLSQLVPHHLSIPASSAPVERLFSIAGKVFRPERCSLKDSTFEQLMFIRCNGK